MQRQTSSSKLSVAAILGGIAFVALAALLTLGNFTFSPALFLALIVALIAAVVLFLGFRRGPEKEQPDLSHSGGSHAADADREPGSAGILAGTAGVPVTETAPVTQQSDRAEGGASETHAGANPDEAVAARAGEGESAAGTGAFSGTTPSPDHTAAPATTEGLPDAGTGPSEEEEVDADVPDADPDKSKLAGDEDGAASRPAADEAKAPPGSGATTMPYAKASQLDREAKAGQAEREPNGAVGHPPARLDSPREGGKDDLKQIRGVGPKLEESLNGMGVYHLDQIAGWSAEELSWVDENLEGFKRRASRDEWIAQARELSQKDS